ncbi:MAG TPA: GGDEF domain-containing protein [Holophagaceae bacterium]|nr:GGDEF domain-containing protein [Holophagaceae bacterium]
MSDTDPTKTQLVAFHTAAGNKAAGSPACLVQVYGGELGRRVAMGPGGLNIGREANNDFGANDITVSRRHAQVRAEGQGYVVEDLGSTNGTFVNEAPVRGRQALRNGDFVRCGGIVLKFIEGGNLESLYHEEIYKLAITDGLTQVANKRCLLEFLERELTRVSRHKRPLTLAIADVDHFKKVNDTYGHLAGDRVLKGVAEAMQRLMRRDELLARYGGEEFVVVLPETPMERAIPFAERIRKVVENEEIDADGHALRVTISLGLAEVQPDEDRESLIRRADALLYQAKHEGRNRVVAG